MAHVAYWHHGHQDNVRHTRHCSTHFQLTMVAKVGSVLEHQWLAGRPSGSEFSRNAGRLLQLPPGPAQNFNRHPASSTPGRSPAITLQPQLLHSLSLLRLSLRVLSLTSKTVRVFHLEVMLGQVLEAH